MLGEEYCERMLMNRFFPARHRDGRRQPRGRARTGSGHWLAGFHRRAACAPPGHRRLSRPTAWSISRNLRRPDGCANRSWRARRRRAGAKSLLRPTARLKACWGYADSYLRSALSDRAGSSGRGQSGPQTARNRAARPPMARDPLRKAGAASSSSRLAPTRSRTGWKGIPMARPESQA